MSKIRYLVPTGADWAVWDDVNAILSFMTDAEVVENARENERQLGDEFAKSPLPEHPTPEEAWEYVDELWEGDPGGRGRAIRVPAGATWLSLPGTLGDRDAERDNRIESPGDGDGTAIGFGACASHRTASLSGKPEWQTGEPARRDLLFRLEMRPVSKREPLGLPPSGSRSQRPSGSRRAIEVSASASRS